MHRVREFAPVIHHDDEYQILVDDQVSSGTLDALMSREELRVLTGTKQPKRMCAWLETRGWAHEAPARRGDIPKVLRAYRDARLSGVRTERTKRADYAFMMAGLA